MLQTSEYNIHDYLVWYYNTHDFTHIEKRKQLVKTKKALLLLAIAWMIVFLLAILAIASLWIDNSLKYVLFFAIIFLSPYILVYTIIIPLLAIKIIQKPIEYWIINQARQKLKSHKAIKVGIAGSFGKTTMREILKTVLSEGKKVAVPPNNFNTPLGISQFAKKLKGDEDVLIFELGEYYPGDIKKLCELTQPSIGIITGINEAHLQKFKSLERTTETIYELTDYLEVALPKTKTQTLYVNGESALARKNARSNHIIYNRQGVNGWKIENPQTSLDGTSFTLINPVRSKTSTAFTSTSSYQTSNWASGDTKLELKSALLGLHQIGPLAAAADIAFNLGLSFNQIREGISKTKSFEHRLEPKIGNDGVITLDDSYNGNPDGVKAVIEFLGSLKDHRRFYVTPGLVEMGSKTEEVHKAIGKNLARAKIEKVVLIKNSVTPHIEKGLREENYAGEVLWFDDALAAFAALPNLTVKGDVVVLQNDWPDQYQ